MQQSGSQLVSHPILISLKWGDAVWVLMYDHLRLVLRRESVLKLRSLQIYFLRPKSEKTFQAKFNVIEIKKTQTMRFFCVKISAFTALAVCVWVLFCAICIAPESQYALSSLVMFQECLNILNGVDNL